MIKVLSALFSFFVFGIIATQLYPRNPHSQSRSIASASGHGLTATKFLVVFEKIRATKLEVVDFANEHGKPQVSEQGLLNGIVSEYNGEPSHEISYYLEKDNGEMIKINLPSAPDSKLIGKRVSFDGFKEQDKNYGIISGSSGDIIILQDDKHPRFRTEKMLILFFSFNSSPRTYLNMDEAQVLADGGYSGIFNHMSDFKLKHDIDISGWHHLDRNEDEVSGYSICNISNGEIKDAILADGLEVTDYDNISVITNCSSYGTIGGHATLSAWDWLGVGRKSTYVKMASHPTRLANDANEDVPGWSSFVSILVHERGHNFGLMHANALDCGSNQFLQDCKHYEYANKFSRMGGPDSTYTFQANHQLQAGWKNEQKDFHHIKESGTYIIDRLTESNPNRKIGAFIYKPGSETKMMMLEYRQADKYDNRLQNWIFRHVDKGIHLYSVMGPSAADRSPKIGSQFRYIDAKPTSLDWHDDTAYESMNSSYYDPLTGATIYMQAVLGTKALVYVEFDEEKQMCFKTSVQEKVARPFITRYTPIQDYESEVLLKPMIDNGGGTKPRPVITKPKRKMMKRSRGRRRPASVEKKLISNLRNSIHIKKKHIVLVPGDNFRVRHETMLGDPIYCPRSRYKVEWTNGDNFFSWMKPIPPKPGNDFNTKPDGTIDGPGGKSRTTPLYTPPPTFNTSVYFYNYAEEYSLHPELIVPVDALGKNYLMHFQVTDVETGELITKKVYVYVRSKHDAIIEMQADKYDM